MGRLGRGRDSGLIRDLYTIRRPLVWHPNLVSYALLKDHSHDNSERSSCNDSERPDDEFEMSIDG